MNRIYRVIWSEALRTWVVASELAKARGKSSSRRSAVMSARGGSLIDSTRATSPRLASLGALLALSTSTVYAADLYWDPNNTGVGSGGAGTWSTSGNFWSRSADGVTGPYSSWNNLALDDAIFNNAGGDLSLGVPITVHNLTFNANGYKLGSGTLTHDPEQCVNSWRVRADPQRLPHSLMRSG